MKKPYIVLSCFSLAVAPLSYGVFYQDISPAASLSGNILSASFTTSESYNNAYVVIGWDTDNGGIEVGSPSLNLDGGFSAVNPDPASQYDGGNNGFNLFYKDVGSLSAGTHNVDLPINLGTLTKIGLSAWVIGDVTLNDTGFKAYIDDDNGGGGGVASAFGFNLTGSGNPAATAVAGENELTIDAGNYVIGYFGGGNGVSNQVIRTLGGTADTAPTDMWDLGTLGVNTGGSYYAAHIENAAAGAELGWESDGSWFRMAAGGLSFNVIPEPSSYGLLAGLLVSGAVMIRRRK